MGCLSARMGTVFGFFIRVRMDVYSTEDEQVEFIKGFLKKYGVTILLAFVLFCAAHFSYDYWQEHKATYLVNASEKYYSLIAADVSDQDIRAITLELQTDYPDTIYASLASLVAAQKFVDADGDKYLSWLADNGSVSELLALAKIRTALIKWNQGDIDSAMGKLDEVKESGFLAYASELKGDISVSTGNKQQAIDFYKQAKSYQGSKFSPLLLAKLNNLETSTQ